MKRNYALAAIVIGVLILGTLTLLPRCKKKPPEQKVVIVLANKREEFKLSALKTKSQAEKIREALQQTPGVSTVTVSLETQKVSVDYDYRKLSKETLSQRIKSLGLDPKAPTDNHLRVLQYNVQIRL